MSQIRSTCREVHDHASAFVDGDASEQLPSLKEHLDRCPPCREYLRQIGLTVDLLHALPGEPATEARGTLMGLFDKWCADRGKKDP
jgi:predicted anti-sigma-YlaC factor YlaD